MFEPTVNTSLRSVRGSNSMDDPLFNAFTRIVHFEDPRAYFGRISSSGSTRSNSKSIAAVSCQIPHPTF